MNKPREIPLDLEELAAANNERNEEWPGAEYCDLAFRGLEMAGEVGEACNAVKKLIRNEYRIKGNTGDRQQYIDHALEEMADAIITVDLLRMEMEKRLGIKIDLGSEVRKKFNKTSDKNGLNTKL